MEPTFTRTPVDKTVKLGDTAVLNCRATGSPQPVIFWQKESLEVNKKCCIKGERSVHVLLHLCFKIKDQYLVGYIGTCCKQIQKCIRKAVRVCNPREISQKSDQILLERYM